MKTPDRIDYPPTRRVEQVDDYFGTRVEDPFRWLEDDHAPETKAWVAAQNRVTEAWFDAHAPWRPALRERLRAIADHPKVGVPFEQAGLVFFTRNSGLQNQPVLYVQRGLDAEPAVLLDPNAFSADGTVQLKSFAPDRHGRWLAWSRTAIAGSDWEEIRILDLETRRELPEVLRWVRFSITAWRGDGFYYARYPEPEPGRELTAPALHQAIWYHRVGTPQSEDVRVADDPAHPAWLVQLATTPDERFAVLWHFAPGRRGNDLFVRDERRGETAFRPIVAEVGEDTFDVVAADGDALLVRTPRSAPNGRVVRIDVDAPDESGWTTVVAERTDPLESIVATGGRLYATWLRDVASHVEVLRLDGSTERTIALEGRGTVEGFAGGDDARHVFFAFESIDRPRTVHALEAATGATRVFAAPEIRGFDADRYTSELVFVTSRDGTRVPLFVARRKDLARDGEAPTLLHGYGGFNVAVRPSFVAARIAWLEQGGVFAVANLRGGSEYGEAWHEAGMRERKQNVFDDFIAAAEHLCAAGWTRPGRLAVQGGSNGGLLVGAVVNQRPDLFAVALPRVGVMDMLRYQRFSIGSAWVSELGSSDDEAGFRTVFRYSPLHNVEARDDLPAILVMTSDHDDRVVPAHSFKYAATLQAKAAGGRPKLIRIETASGHGASNLAKSLDEAGDAFSFAWANMGFVPRL